MGTIYNENAVCRICGYSKRVQVEVWGSYDGPDEPLDIKDCPICKKFTEIGIDISKLTQFARDQLAKEKEAHKETKEQLATERYRVFELELFNNMSCAKKEQFAKKFKREEAQRRKACGLPEIKRN